MKSILVDTNTIIRYLYDQKSPLHIKAKQFFIDAATGKHKILLDNIIIAEIIWVLTSYYKKTKAQIIPSLTQLVQRPWVIIDNQSIVQAALDLFASNNFSYIDCYLHCLAKSKSLSLITFDKKLSKI